MGATCGTCTGVLSLCVFLFLPVCPAQGETLKVVTHIHSRYSHTGKMSLEQIIERARAKGIDVVIPTDTFMAAWEYGLWPLRGLARRRMENSSVASVGVERYLAELGALAGKHRDILIIPGVEAAAYYRWEGSPWKSLALTDWHRHLLVLGLQDPGDYRRLPVAGNREGAPFRLILAWPAILLLALAVLVWLWGRRKAGLILVGFSVLFFVDGWPFRRFPEGPYKAETPWAPYQRLIDYALERGGLAVWAHPDAPNWSDPQQVAPRVWIRTRPYPEAIVRTVNHHGFAVFQEGYRHVSVPGGPWDQELKLYLAGQRERPSWAFAELDFKALSRNEDLDMTMMMVDAASRTPSAVLEGLRQGRFYSVWPMSGPPIILRRWSLSAGGKSAGSGETLRYSNLARLEVELAYADGSSGAAQWSLVRDGLVLANERIELPASWSYVDKELRSPKTYYRVHVVGRGGSELMSNPIFHFRK